MATLIETLIGVLNEECDVFDQLLSVSRQKTQAIISSDMEQLKKVTDLEQDVLTTITNLENKREEATVDIATVLGKDPKGVTLKDVIGFLDGQADVQNQLADVHDRLLKKVQRLAEENQHNEVLVRDQLEMIEFNLNVIQSLDQAPQTGAYNSGAYNAGSTFAPTHGYFDSSS